MHARAPSRGWSREAKKARQRTWQRRPWDTIMHSVARPVPTDAALTVLDVLGPRQRLADVPMHFDAGTRASWRISATRFALLAMVFFIRRMGISDIVPRRSAFSRQKPVTSHTGLPSLRSSQTNIETIAEFQQETGDKAMGAVQPRGHASI